MEWCRVSGLMERISLVVWFGCVMGIIVGVVRFEAFWMRVPIVSERVGCFKFMISLHSSVP